MKKLYFVVFMLSSVATTFAQNAGKIEKPVIVHKALLLSYFQSLNIDTQDCYVPKGEHYEEVVNLANGLYSAVIFDSNGKKIRYTTSRLGCMNPSSYLADLRFISDYPRDSSDNLTNFLSLVTPYTTTGNAAHYDYTVVIFWTKYLGTDENKQKIVRWEQILKANKKINTRIIKVNMDVQETWEEADKLKYQAVHQKIYEHVIEVNQ